MSWPLHDPDAAAGPRSRRPFHHVSPPCNQGVDLALAARRARCPLPERGHVPGATSEQDAPSRDAETSSIASFVLLVGVTRCQPLEPSWNPMARTELDGLRGHGARRLVPGRAAAPTMPMALISRVACRARAEVVERCGQPGVDGRVGGRAPQAACSIPPPPADHLGAGHPEALRWGWSRAEPVLPSRSRRSSK